jgi:putative transcriptional regulator
MSNEPTTTDERDRFGMTAEDWQRLDGLTDDEITAAALTDPDNPPLTPEQLAMMRRPSLARRVRGKLRMTRERFAVAYGIPVDVLRSWERFETEPTAVEARYLELIERDPERATVIHSQTAD